MLTSKQFAFLSIFLGLNCVSTNAGSFDYTVITSKMVEETFVSAGYNPAQDCISRWFAERSAITLALDFIHRNLACILPGQGGLPPRIFGVEAGEIEFIVASTCRKALSYVKGVAKRLENTNLPSHEKPSQIIVVYTLNYTSDVREAIGEYAAFKTVLDELVKVASGVNIPVTVEEFRPVVKGSSRQLDFPFDMHNFKTLTMTEEELKTQAKRIEDLQLGVNSVSYIEPVDFLLLLSSTKIKKIVDVVGSDAVEVVGANQLLTAIRRAQLRIMSIAINGHKKLRKDLVVLCIDGPSAMDEKGNWTIHFLLAYPVDIILSFVWHKPLVNSLNLMGYPKAIVLDIWYNSVRLFDRLLDTVIPQNIALGGYPALVEDVTTAQGIPGRTVPILFYHDAGYGRMKVGGYPTVAVVPPVQYYQPPPQGYPPQGTPPQVPPQMY